MFEFQHFHAKNPKFNQISLPQNVFNLIFTHILSNLWLIFSTSTLNNRILTRNHLQKTN